MVQRVPLTHGRFALVDDEDYPIVSQWKWSYRVRKTKNTGYAYRQQWDGRCWKKIYMHRIILGVPSGLFVDHKSGDGLDNTRQNLRIATAAENNRNICKPRHGKSSRFKGVNWEKRNSRYRAQIKAGGKHINLGLFKDEGCAAWAYDRAARNLHGAFARCNFPPPPMVIAGGQS